MPLAPGTVLEDKYRVDSLVGTGGMGSVFLATHLHLERPVAIKVIRGDVRSDPAIAGRFRREALAIARLNHPNVVTVYDFGFDDEGNAYLVMEYLHGRSLADEILFRQRIPAAESVSIIRQVCAGIRAAHAEGVIHRDIKPDNIFLEETTAGTIAKVLDFGIAKLEQSPASTESTITRHGVVLGSPHYLSPERCMGQPAESRSDVYSLGCVLYEMLTGRPPFRAKAAPAVMLKHVRQAPDPPSRDADGVGPELEAVVLRALAKDPNARYQSVDELAAALGAAAEASRASGPTGQTLASPSRPPNNLPAPFTRFVGRQRELAEVRQLLGSSPLVTIWGPAGVGKTRIALGVATDALDEFHDGAWLVELTRVGDGSLVPEAVLTVAGVRSEPGRDPLATLVAWARPRSLLLILDGCEHLVDACARLVTTLARACPDLRILVTSREALDVAGEAVVRVASLSLPETARPGERISPEAARAAEAVELFVDRARLTQPGFELNEENAAAVAELCRRLDGIPLAIELAAARVRLLSIDQLLTKLGDRFRLLGGGGPASARRQTLRAAMDWGYSLLCDREQALLRRIAVFAGGCSIDAIEEVCAAPPVGREAVLDLVTGLVNKSFVISDESGPEARYRLLETIREYAAERLVEADEARWVEAAHLTWCVRVARKADASFAGPDSARWLWRLELEHDNMRAALQRAKRAADARPLVELSAALGRFWAIRGHLTEGGAWLEDAVAAGGTAPAPLRARLLHWAGAVAAARGDLTRAGELLERALAANRETGDRASAARTCCRLGDVASYLGDYGRAEGLYVRALVDLRELDDTSGIALAVGSLGILATEQGDHRRAASLLGESLALFRKAGGRISVSRTLHNLATTELRLGEFSAAETHANESLAIARELGDRGLAACAVHVLGDLALERGDFDDARASFEEVLAGAGDLGDRRFLAALLESCARLAAATDDHRRALRLAGAAMALRETSRARLPESERERFARALAPARSAFGADADAEIAAGRTLAATEALSLAALPHHAMA